MTPSPGIRRTTWTEAVVLAAVLALGAWFVRDARMASGSGDALARRLTDLESRRERLAEEARKAEAERIALERDPFAVERRLRERLGRSRPGEIRLER